MSANNEKDPRKKGPDKDSNVTEEVLRQGGKSEEEVKRTGAVDRADDQVEEMFEPKHRTENSPVHKAVWDNRVPFHLLKAPLANAGEPCEAAMNRCLAIVQRRIAEGSHYDANGKVSQGTIDELAEAGYWGLLIDKEYGGQGASHRAFMTFLTRMSAAGCPTTAGLASIHGCIGAVDPVRTFGDDGQKKAILPKLASGEKISGFALTEPNAGSDLTALRTTFTADGDDFLVNGEKLFISNAICGRTIGLVGLLNGKPAVLVADLPDKENEHFQIVRYGLHCLKHTHNNGLRFVNFRVPKTNLLKVYNKASGEWEDGKGLQIAYHGLNRGRVALCANAAGVMRRIERSITPKSWGDFRKTYGQSIEKRELVKARIARGAALIVGADALVAWCSSLLDEGYRGELECIIAKIFGSAAQWEMATEIGMTTHGGRAMLEGHLIGDNLHDYAAPRIYEGENQMLAMALFKTLAKKHGLEYMLPTGNAVNDLLTNKASVGAWTVGGAAVGAGLAWATGGLSVLVGAAAGGALGFAARSRNLIWNGARYTLWQAVKRLAFFTGSDGSVDRRLRRHVKFAKKMLKALPLELSAAMVKHQLKLADRQCRIAHMSQRVMDAVTVLVACEYASQLGDDATVAAADVLAQQLRMKLTGEQPSDAYFKACSKLADMVIEGRFRQLDGVPETPILRTYTV